MGERTPSHRPSRGRHAAKCTQHALAMDTVLHDVRPAPIRRHPFLFATLFAGSLAIVGIPLLVGWWAWVRSARRTITSAGTILTSGLCWGGYSHVRHGEVSELHVKQSAWQRLISPYGAVEGRRSLWRAYPLRNGPGRSSMDEAEASA